MSLTNMQLPKRKRSAEEAISVTDELRFPYGLQIDLDDESLRKLNISNLPEAGAQFLVVGIGPVTSVRQTDNKRGKDRSLTIQLQKIEVGPVKTGKIKTAVDAVSAGIKQADGD